MAKFRLQSYSLFVFFVKFHFETFIVCDISISYYSICRAKEEMEHYVGVDVGTGSVRAALVANDGTVVQTAEEPIQIHTPQAGFYEQSSEDIWRAVIITVNVGIRSLSYSL